MINGNKNPNAPDKSDSKISGLSGSFPMQHLPMATEAEEENDYPEESMTYIAYGEKGEDVAFEISEDLEEAVEIYASMKEDGFKVRLFQAQEVEIVDN